jgi:hypothetical protein
VGEDQRRVSVMLPQIQIHRLLLPVAVVEPSMKIPNRKKIIIEVLMGRMSVE